MRLPSSSSRAFETPVPAADGTALMTRVHRLPLGIPMCASPGWPERHVEWKDSGCLKENSVLLFTHRGQGNTDGVIGIGVLA